MFFNIFIMMSPIISNADDINDTTSCFTNKYIYFSC